MIPCSETFTDAFLPEPRTPADHARLLRTIAAFANTAGGRIWLGVAPDGTVTGLRDPDDFERQLPDLLRDGIQPCLLPFVETERVRLDGRTVLRLHVEAGAMRPCVPAPLYKTETETEPEPDGTVWVRRGKAVAPATTDEIAAMVRAANPTPFEARTALRQDLTFNACAGVFRQRGLPFGHEESARPGQSVSPGLPVNPKTLPPGFWDHRRRACTNLAHICSDQSEHAIVLTRFADDGKLRVLDAERIVGSVLEHFIRAEDFLDRAAGRGQHLHVRPDVLREALAAALTLRDYARKTSLLVDVTPSNVTFSVIGGLTEPMSPADAALRLRTDCRNPELLRLFERLGLTAGSDTGFELIRGWAKGASVEALLNVTTSSVTITLPRLPIPTTLRTPSPTGPNSARCSRSSRSAARLRRSPGRTSRKPSDGLRPARSRFSPPWWRQGSLRRPAAAARRFTG